MTKSTKIKVYIDALPLCNERMSGIGHLTLEIVRALSKLKDLDIRLVVPLGKRKLVSRHDIESVCIRTLPIPARAISTLIRLQLMPPVDLLLGPGVYLFTNYRNWPLLRSKSLTYFHDASFMLYPETVSPKNLKYLRRNSRRWLQRADTVITLTKSSKRDIMSALNVPSQKINVVYCGVNHDTFTHKNPEEVKKVKQRYGITTNNYILYVGNFEPRKNLDRLISAYVMLPPDLRKEYGLVLVGGGGWLNNHTLENIIYLREQGYNILKPDYYVKDEDLPAIYSGANLLIHPALYEGFGLSPLQAMACQTPVAVSDNSSLPEVVGKAGVYFDAKSEADISAKIKEVLTHAKLRHNMVEEGAKQARKFSWDRSANELHALIKGTR